MAAENVPESTDVECDALPAESSQQEFPLRSRCAAQVLSLAGVHLCDIFEEERDLMLQDLQFKIQERVSIPAKEQQLLFGDDVLADTSARPLAGSTGIVVLSLIRKEPFSWGLHENEGARLEGRTYTKTKQPPNFSVVLSEAPLSSSVRRHTLFFRKVAGSSNLCRIGLAEPQLQVNDNVAFSNDSYVASYRDDGGYLDVYDCGNESEVERNAPKATAEGSEVEMVFDSAERSLSFKVNGANAGVISGLKESANHVFIQLYRAGDAWELVNYSPA